LTILSLKTRKSDNEQPVLLSNKKKLKVICLKAPLKGYLLH